MNGTHTEHMEDSIIRGRYNDRTSDIVRFPIPIAWSYFTSSGHFARHVFED